MTIAEIQRAVESAIRERERIAKERAAFNYILADLIGRSCGRVYSSSVEMPSIYEAYPSLFNDKEMQEKQVELKDELSALRFRQFAKTFNKNFNN